MCVAFPNQAKDESSAPIAPSMVCAQFRLAFSSIRLFSRSLPSMTCSWIKGWSDDSMQTLIKETFYSKLVLISFNASLKSWPFGIPSYAVLWRQSAESCFNQSQNSSEISAGQLFLLLVKQLYKVKKIVALSSRHTIKVMAGASACNSDVLVCKHAGGNS